MRFHPLFFTSLVLSLATAGLAAETAGSPVAFRGGLGVEQPVNEHLNGVLEAQGLATVPAASLVAVGWGYGLNFGGLLTEIVGSRVSNTTFGALSGATRTRFVEDTSAVTFGARGDLPAGFFVTAGAGVAVSKFLLQTYGAGATTLTGALATKGQVSLVSSWNWSPVAAARLGWRFAPVPNTAASWTLSLGVSGNAFLFPFTWKLGDDVAVSGLGAPWDAAWTPMLWLGFE